MAIKFKRDKDGNIIAVDDKGKKIGNVSSMGDAIKEQKKDTSK